MLKYIIKRKNIVFANEMSQQQNDNMFNMAFKFIVIVMKITGLLSFDIKEKKPDEFAYKNSWIKSSFCILYSFIMTIVKIIFAPIYMILLTCSDSFKELIIIRRQTNITSSSDGDNVLLNAAMVIFSIQLVLYLLVFFFLNVFSRLHFDASVQSFKSTKTELIRFYREHGQSVSYKQHYYWIFEVIYFFLLIGLQALSAVFLYELFPSLYNPYFMNVYGNTFAILFLVFISIIVIDISFSFYYFATFVFHAVDLFSEFSDSFKRVIEAKTVSEVVHTRIDLEKMRHLYNKLCNYVEEIDKLISLITIVIYSTSIPSICLFLYCTFKATESIEFQKYAFMIVFSAYELVIFSFLGILLNSKTRCFIPHLFRLNLNSDVFERRNQIDKLNFFMQQVKFESLGITVGRLITISVESTATVIGVIVSFFLLILDVNEKLSH